MKFLSTLIVAVTLLFTSCKKDGIATDTPDCIKETIKSNKDRSDWYIGNVEEYKFQGKLVYAFIPDTRVIADASTAILTSDCTPLCQVGGFGGPFINLCNARTFFKMLYW